jgi:hypothetical protein
MEPIHVPSPPSEAFNKNRRISDLIRAQTNHLKHLEEKMPASVRQQIPKHAIITEADAASYTAAMTRLLRAQGGSVATPAAQSPAVAQVIPIQPAQGLQLAANAETAGAGSKSESKAGNKSGKGGSSRKEKKR